MSTTADANLASEHATEADEPTVLAAWTATVVRALEAAGIDGLAIARAAGIDPQVFALDDGRIPLSRTTELWRLAVVATGDPCLGLDVSRFVRPTTFNALSLGVLASETMRDALDRVIRFAGIVLNTTVQSTGIEADGGYAYTSRSLPGTTPPSYEAMEAILASIVRAARFLLDRSVSPSEVRLRRPEQPPSRRFETFFGCPVVYGSDHYRLAFDAAVVNRPLPTACSPLARTADRLAADQLERVRPVGSVTERVHAVVCQLLPEGEPAPGAVASRLAMSGRTMQRRLHDEGTTFRDVLAEARISQAKQLIAAEGLAAHQVAHRLGFSDASAFRRAFKRRTGMTVGAFAVQVGASPWSGSVGSPLSPAPDPWRSARRPGG